MHRIDFPAGSTIRLTATALPDLAVHRWDLQVFDAVGSAAPRLTFGSQIGGRDCQQQVSIPAQDADCRLEVRSRHAVGDDWADDRCSVVDDTPNRLLLGFAGPSAPAPGKNDVSLSFAIVAGRRDLQGGAKPARQ